jgi:hypothetical protein
MNTHAYQRGDHRPRIVPQFARCTPDHVTRRVEKRTLPCYVVLPVLHFHVEGAVYFENQHVLMGEIPLGVGESQSAVRVESPALSRRPRNSELGAYPSDVDLRH